MRVVVHLGLNRLGGALTTPHPIFVSGDSLQVCPAALPETSIYTSGRVVFVGGCRMWTKLPPEVDQTSAGGGENFCRGLGSSMVQPF